MRCGECKEEAVLVNLGREIGTYYYCRKCKLEEKEWKALADARKVKLEDIESITIKSVDLPPRTAVNSASFSLPPKPTQPKVIYRGCLMCGAPEHAACAPNCLAGGTKLYD